MNLVIPKRNTKTLEHAGAYYILFANLGHAQLYQNHVVRVHRTARIHTPTSLESPLLMQPRLIISDEDIHTLLRDYALCPPSQRLQLRILHSPRLVRKTALSEDQGYPQLVKGKYKIGRSILFWVNGYDLTRNILKNTIAADGRDRGLAWNVSIEKVDLPQGINDGNDIVNNDYDRSIELKAHPHISPRWIVVLANENEARRFIRTWHQKPFPLARENHPKLIHTEFLW